MVNQKPVLIWDVGGVILEWNILKFSESYENGRYKDQCIAIFNHEHWWKFDRGDLSYANVLDIYSKQFDLSKETINTILQSSFHYMCCCPLESTMLYVVKLNKH